MIRGGTMPQLTRPKARGAAQRGSALKAGPCVGVRDSLDPERSSDPSRAYAVQNMYPLELDKPTSFVGRPGFDQAGTQLGASGKRTGQLVYQFTQLDGTEITLAIVGGQGIYTYNWSTDTWSQVVTVANLATASITLSETARCYAATYTNKVLISDGTNTPFLWDGTSGAGGLTSLTNAPVFYGRPRIHYAKVFGITNTSRNVLDWSEENDATIGYETAPYSNTWQLGQTDQEGLVAIVPTNDALYYLRARSIGRILGAVTPEFTSDGTHEGVSQSVGTASPDGVCVVGRDVYFIDADARPHAIIGGQAVPLFDDLRETLQGAKRSSLSNAICRYDPTLGLVLFAATETSQTNPSVCYVYNPVLRVPVAVWRGWTMTAMDVVKNGDSVPVLMHLSSDGYAYAHGTPTGSTWDDNLNAGTAAIAHAFEFANLGVDNRAEKRFTRADIILRAEANASSVNLTYTTPYGVSSSQSASVSGSGAQWDAAVWDTDVWGYDTVERHVGIGLLAQARWIRPRITHEVVGEQFGVTSIAVEARYSGDAAAAA